MKIIKTKFKDLIIYNKETYRDKRGYFRELFLNRQIQEKFPFDVMSYSKKNVLRGLHLQLRNKQSKYVNVLKGKRGRKKMYNKKSQRTLWNFSVDLFHYLLIKSSITGIEI